MQIIPHTLTRWLPTTRPVGGLVRDYQTTEPAGCVGDQAGGEALRGNQTFFGGEAVRGDQAGRQADE